MPIFTIPIHESNDCHTPAGSPEGGQFCSGTGKVGGEPKRERKGRVRGGDGYKIVFRSQREKVTGYGGHGGWPPYINREVEQQLNSDDLRKLRSARVMLMFEPGTTAHLGAPIKWTAPNGVTVAYLRGQRRDEKRGSGTYHDFRVDADEQVVPLTRNVGPGRRALRAWAKEHITNVITARMQARQLVRPGD